MQAVAHNPAFAKKAGVPQSVGKEFTKSGGGMKSSTTKKMAMGGMGQIPMKPRVANPVSKPPTPRPPNPVSRPPTSPRKGPNPLTLNKPSGMAKGGLAAGHKSADGIARKGKTQAEQVKMAKGGTAKMRKGGYC